MSDDDLPVVEGVARDAPAPAAPVAAPPAASTAIARAPSREVLMPLDTDRVIEGMRAYQAMLPQLLDESDYQDAGRGKRFVKKSGWRKIARAFNLSTEIVSVEVERAPDGSPLRGRAIVRATAPNSQWSEGDGYCDAAEERFSGPRGNRTKLENDLRATATTRAKNRAISDLVGMGEVSAEEVAAGGGDADAGPAYGVAATDDSVASARRALMFLFDPDATDDPDVIGALADDALAHLANPERGLGYLPFSVTWAIARCAAVLKAAMTPAPATPTPADNVPTTSAGTPYGEPPADPTPTPQEAQDAAGPAGPDDDGRGDGGDDDAGREPIAAGGGDDPAAERLI